MSARAQLIRAHEGRRRRLEAAVERQIDTRLDAVGLSERSVENLGTADVSPADRTKLKGIIARLARQKKPFSVCMRDLRKHQPDWSDERRKRTCQTLKTLAGRSSDKAGALSEDGACVLVDERIAVLLEHADLSQLEGVGDAGSA